MLRVKECLFCCGIFSPPSGPALRDDQIALLLSNEDVYDPALGIDDGYTFYIQERRSRRRAGYISLRLGESPQLYYLGHIGYRIEEPFRGHGYAACACQLLIPFMRQLNLSSVCITADPDNTPSRKTCEHLGCVLESIVPGAAELFATSAPAPRTSAAISFCWMKRHSLLAARIGYTMIKEARACRRNFAA